MECCRRLQNPLKKGDANNYQGHECVLILNRTNQDAYCSVDISPYKGISFVTPAERISTFYTEDQSMLGGAGLDIMTQYSTHISSNVTVRRMDVKQDNRPLFNKYEISAKPHPPGWGLASNYLQ